MVDLRIKIPVDFLSEEVRCGYRITRQMKEVWAVELDLLSEFQRVCKKNNLTYFADSGTLIGAIRHKGFIPWDDDIDLVMPRDDYNKLQSIASKEFIFPYFWQDAYSEEDIYLRAHSQLRNSNTTAIIEGDENLNINKGIFIDIFPIDVIPEPNSIKFKSYISKIKLAWRLLCDIEYNSQKHTVKGKAFHFFASVIVNKYNFKSRFKQYERLCSKYNSTDNEYVSYIAYSKGKRKHLWKRSWFKNSESVKFEFTEINVPVGYDERLRTEYGDYMKPSEAPTAHGDVCFDTNSSYKEVEKSE